MCNFPIGILGRVWYLIVSTLDLCTLTNSLKLFFIGGQLENAVVALTNRDYNGKCSLS